MLEERIISLRNKMRNTTPTVSIERARLVTEFYRKLSMDSVITKRAKLLEYLLQNMTIYIDDESLLVGNHGSRYRSAPVFPEVSAWLRGEIDSFETRSADPFLFVGEEKEELRAILEEWKGNTFQDLVNQHMTEKETDIAESETVTFGCRQLSTGCHYPDYAKLMKVGYKGIIQECEQKLEAIREDSVENASQKEVLCAMIRCLKAAIMFAHRYAKLATDMAESCVNLEQVVRLKRIAQVCQSVPENAPENLHQALQMIWFTHLIIQIENIGQNHGFGRFDQYLFPIYQQDLENGVSREQEKALIEEFRIKCAEILILRTKAEAESYAGCPMWFQLTIGGVLENGQDACNDLTDLVLESVEEVETAMPTISYRYHSRQNPITFQKALRIVQKGSSHPAFYNDDICIPTVLSTGATIKEARNYSVFACIEANVPGKTDFNPSIGYMCSTKILELALHNGYDPLTGKQLGPETGDATKFTTMEQVLNAYREQQTYFMMVWMTAINKIISLHAAMMPTIFASSFMDGCISKAKVLQQGGAKYRITATSLNGFANTVDSMASLEKNIFMEKKMTMKELLHLLDTNFEGQEAKRQMLLHHAPKYGNDDAFVDKYAIWLSEIYADDCERMKDARGGYYTGIITSQSYNVVQGKYVGATPDGRLAYTTLADNASPSMGRDNKGPTAAVKSVSNIDTIRVTHGALLNQKFDPVLINGEKGLDILGSVITGYFKNGGQHIQINVLDTETLRKAQKNPDEYRNLLVRVAGYSAYFVDLEKEVQEDIIARTTQKM